MADVGGEPRREHPVTHRQYWLTADHLAGHFAPWPADELAGLMMGAFSSCGDTAYRAHGDALMEEQAALAGPESWPWMSWLASARAEQGRVREAHELAEQALALYPRSGVAAHALAHAEHELGTGRACGDFLDQWLRADPQAVQSRHLNWHAALQSIACGDFPDARRRATRHWRVRMSACGPRRTGVCSWSDSHRPAKPTRTWSGNCSPHRAGWRRSSTPSTSRWPWPWRRPPTTCASCPVGLPPTNAPISAMSWLPWCKLWRRSPRAPRVAVDLLSSLGEKAERIGGVRVEREIIQDTLARALVDAGQHVRAAGLLHHRTTTRHHHTYEDLLLAARTPAAVVDPR
ncbi:hypothetical protein ACIODT_36770 [Streptomyces sp. NPDC088251]|uniref:hypothetical protein n=2 Tax=unclassified Streptomyces TaxID=2593676 RepID=UPI00380ABE49